MTFQTELYAKELGQLRVERTNEEWIASYEKGNA